MIVMSFNTSYKLFRSFVSWYLHCDYIFLYIHSCTLYILLPSNCIYLERSVFHSFFFNTSLNNVKKTVQVSWLALIVKMKRRTSWYREARPREERKSNSKCIFLFRLKCHRKSCPSIDLHYILHTIFLQRLNNSFMWKRHFMWKTL